MNSEKNITIGKIILSLIAIGVMFVPVYAVQTIEARAVDHALEVEGLYVNGTGLEAGAFNATYIEDIYNADYVNDTVGSDSAIFITETGTYDSYVVGRDRLTYFGNGTYTVGINYTDSPVAYGDIQQAQILIPLDITVEDFMEADFIRITHDFSDTLRLYVFDEDSETVTNIVNPVTVAVGQEIFVNSIMTRSMLSSYPNGTIWVSVWDSELDSTTYTIKTQVEIYEGADAFTWTDETLYIMAVMLCDVLLVGAIVFASDPIDIVFQNERRRK